MSEVLPAIRRFFNRHEVRGPGVVAVSGGADSVSLLHGIMAVHREQLIVAHFNHQLRGTESDADEQFVRDLSRQWDLGFSSHSHAVGSEAGNLESLSRRFRYEWLTKLAASYHANWIATGHTADDQAETVLHRLIRGTGIQVLRGIAPVRPVQLPNGHDFRIIRPLLHSTKREVLQYATENSLDFRTDSSNADRRFTRNRIRQELIPLLQTYNGKVVETLGKLSGQADELFNYLETEAMQNLQDCELPRAGGTIVLDKAKSAALPLHQLREFLRLIWVRERWPANDMRYDHWQRIGQIVHGLAGAADMPGGVNIFATPHVVRLERVV